MPGEIIEAVCGAVEAIGGVAEAVDAAADLPAPPRRWWRLVAGIVLVALVLLFAFL